MVTAFSVLLAFAAAFHACVAVFAVLGRALAKYRERYVSPSIQDLGDMFLFVEPGQVLWLTVAAAAALAMLGFACGGPVLAAFAGAGGLFTPPAAVRVCRARRVRRFEAQLAPALQQLASALRAGLTLAQGMEQIAREGPAPLGQEFALLVKETKLGVSLDEALVAMADRVGSEDLELVATSTSIARALGGNVAEIFETIALTVRERFRLEGRIAALTSQGKLQGLIVAALPPLLALFLHETRPDLLQPMFEHAFGYVLVAAIALLETIGFLLIRRITAIEV